MLCLVLFGTLHVNEYNEHTHTFRNIYVYTNYLTSLFSHLKMQEKVSIYMHICMHMCVHVCVCTTIG